jgi:hypothetical protein
MERMNCNKITNLDGFKFFPSPIMAGLKTSFSCFPFSLITLSDSNHVVWDSQHVSLRRICDFKKLDFKICYLKMRFLYTVKHLVKS